MLTYNDAVHIEIILMKSLKGNILGPLAQMRAEKILKNLKEGLDEFRSRYPIVSFNDEDGKGNLPLWEAEAPVIGGLKLDELKQIESVLFKLVNGLPFTIEERKEQVANLCKRVANVNSLPVIPASQKEPVTLTIKHAEVISAMAQNGLYFYDKWATAPRSKAALREELSRLYKKIALAQRPEPEVTNKVEVVCPVLEPTPAHMATIDSRALQALVDFAVKNNDPAASSGFDYTKVAGAVNAAKRALKSEPDAVDTPVPTGNVVKYKYAAGARVFILLDIGLCETEVRWPTKIQFYPGESGELRPQVFYSVYGDEGEITLDEESIFDTEADLLEHLRQKRTNLRQQNAEYEN